MVELINVSKTINGKPILTDINFKTEKGKMIGLEGHNGSGKTMLLRMLCGLIKPTSGTVDIEDGTTFGVIIENPGFMFNETAYNNLKYLADINKRIGEKEITQVLERVGLAEKANVKVKKYSLGMLQKLAISQAVMETPDVLLLDEPFNALDNESCENVKNILLEMKEKGCAIVIVSHTLDFIRDDCDILHKMCDGRLEM